MQQKKSNISLFINRYAKSLLTFELIILITSAAFSIKSITISMTSNQLPDVWTIHEIIMMIWLHIAYIGALSLPVLLLQYIIFLFIKTEKSIRKMNLALIIFSIITFILFIAYMFENNAYRMQKRIRANSAYFNYNKDYDVPIRDYDFPNFI